MSAVFKHRSDTYGASESGEAAKDLLKLALQQNYRGIQVTEANSLIDVRGIDLITATPDGKLSSIESTSYQDPSLVDGAPISKYYLRVPVGSTGDYVKNIFASRAEYWSFYNPLRSKYDFLLFRTTDCQEYIKRHWGTIIKHRISTTNKIDAAKYGTLYLRGRVTGRGDLILFIPIERVLPYALSLHVHVPESQRSWDL